MAYILVYILQKVLSYVSNPAVIFSRSYYKEHKTSSALKYTFIRVWGEEKYTCLLQ
jgi:hypothetical protein